MWSATVQGVLQIHDLCMRYALVCMVAAVVATVDIPVVVPVVGRAMMTCFRMSGVEAILG